MMQTKSGLMLKILLNRYDSHHQKSIFKPFSQEDLSLLNKLDTSINTPENALGQIRVTIQNIHYSWFIPVLQSLPEALMQLTVAALPKKQVEKIQQQLKLKPLERPLAKITRIFLIDRFYELVKPAEILPLSFLPTTSLSNLFKMGKNQLVEIIDLLGVYDLADEVRFIINKDQLAKINACLTLKQKQFLRLSLHQKEKLSSTPLNLKQWDGNREQLAFLLHQRGLIRMSKALCGQHTHAIWHLTHTLDKGRGTILSKYYAPTPIPKVTQALIQQILTVMNFLNLKSGK